MSEPLITVLITTYNYGRFIGECIESVMSQDYPQDRVQIVVVDDGSTDDTAERVKKYGSRIQYHRKENGGQASAFNFGLTHCRGDIIAFLDADDFWMPKKLNRVIAEFKNHPEVGLVYHRLIEFHMKTGERKEAAFLPISGYLPANPRVFFNYAANRTSCLAFRRKFLDQLVPIPERIKVQADGYIASLVAFIVPVLAIPECLGVYRIHGENLYYADSNAASMERTSRRLETTDAVIEGMRDWFVKTGYGVNRREVRTYLMRLELANDAERFKVLEPGRWRFFKHLLKYNVCYRPYISSRLTALNYINAIGSLVVGYRHSSTLGRFIYGLPNLCRQMVRLRSV